MTKRKYYFELPYKLEAGLLPMGKQQLVESHIWGKLPVDLQQKWDRAAALEHTLRISADDLDRIDDATWKVIAASLDLKYGDRT